MHSRIVSAAGTVVVGIDGSPGSAAALRWARVHADRLGDVVPVMTFVSGAFEYGFDPGANGEPYRSEAVLRLTTFLEEHAPELVEAAAVVEQRAGPGLVAAAEHAALLVVGARGWSDRSDRSVGSVGAYCARHAHVPVAIVPEDVPPLGDRLSVVVGIDGSPHSVHALQWTLDHVRRDALVTAVIATESGPIVGDPLSPSAEEVGAAALADLERCVAPVAAEAEGRPSIDLLAMSGDPREALVSAVPGADLVIVGARGHGLVHHLMLGSVSTALTHHPTLPTIVVPYVTR